MAADRPHCERRNFEIKMGRSKFPGKPSKIGNRKRVNLSSCALPQENDSSKAAENIYYGLSVFNETFGDNETNVPGPFHGFSMLEVEEALARARLQQKEAELEHRKHGITIDCWKSFQDELFSIACSSSNQNNTLQEVTQGNKTKLCFDGGGKTQESKTFLRDKNIDTKSNSECTKSQGSKVWSADKKSAVELKSKSECTKSQVPNVSSGKKSAVVNKSSPNKDVKKKLKVKNSPSVKIYKLSSSPNSKKSLQSQAAKKLLDKAKKSSISELNKGIEKKFILPSHSVRSLRVIKPNKRFLQDEDNKKLLRSRTKLLSNSNEAKEDPQPTAGTVENERKASQQEEKAKVKSSVPTTTSGTGKVILREARLQLDNSNTSLMEGPFSSSNASSLSPNSQLKVNTVQPPSIPATVMCGVCGAVRFYRFVKQARKFGIFSCESCRKFISKLIKKQSPVKSDKKMECQKGTGLCSVPPIVRNPQWNVLRCAYNARCQACWLKMCLKNYRMPHKLKQKLSKMLPSEMRRNLTNDLEMKPVATDVSKKFVVTEGNIDFKWLHENSGSLDKLKKSASEVKNSESKKEKSMKKTRKSLRMENVKKALKHTGKKKITHRQMTSLKGPRVKHVCRSASVALGQPIATFPVETKKQAPEPSVDCLDCDVTDTTNIGSGDSQEEEMKSAEVVPSAPISVVDKPVIVVEKKESNSCKSVATTKPPGLMQQNSKSKKKDVKVENLVSMDFWESYDPDEVWETGFGVIGSEAFTLRALCFLCGSAGQEKLVHCASCCEPYHAFCVDEVQHRVQESSSSWRFDWICPRCTICVSCNRSSGQQLRCVRCSNSYHTECVDRLGGRLLHSPDRPWVCSACLRCKSCNGVDVSVFVGNLPLCKPCFVLRQKGNYCPLCQQCYEDDDYDSKMMECGKCQCWVHAKCEGLSDEKYQVLSFLPDSVEFICRMCCSMPPAPWWLAVEAELKAGYLGVLKSLSKNRKACTMLKWSPRKQCTCRQISYVPRPLDFGKSSDDTEEEKSDEVFEGKDEEKEKGTRPAPILERKTSIEVINHPTESLKMTLKIMKPVEDETVDCEQSDSPADTSEPAIKTICKKFNIKQCSVRVKKCSVEDDTANSSQDSLPLMSEGQDTYTSGSSPVHKRPLSSPVNPPSDSGIGSTDDELKPSSLTDDDDVGLQLAHVDKPELVQNHRKLSCDAPVAFFEEKRDCVCFLEVDSYNSRSKPFSPNLLSIKKKVTTSEYSSLQQFHQDMQRMISTTQSTDLMDVYHQTMKEIFPWFDPKFSRVFSSSQKPSGTISVENTPVKATPTKSSHTEACTIPLDKLTDQPLEYYYGGYMVDDTRTCLLCKTIGDGVPWDTGRLLYCGQNEWVHCNCALWSGEVFEEIDGSLQNVHSAINRGRSIRCPVCELKGASVGCCAKNCQLTYHFSCARRVGSVFMDDKTMYCPSHTSESIGKLVQKENEFEIRRPVYVELDKRKMKMADSNQVRVSVGALHVQQLGRFAANLSDQEKAIMPEGFTCTRWFWSCFEPWRVVRYHFTIRLLEVEQDEGVDLGVNLTVDHSLEPELFEVKMKQLKHFQDHHELMDITEEEKRITDLVLEQREEEERRCKTSEPPVSDHTPKRPKKDLKVVRKIFDSLDSKEDENLSDNQNTADLLPPDLEEAIFKDLPNDILDGISMQDIFMDIKNVDFEGNEKDGKDEMSEDIADVEELSGEVSKMKRPNEFVADIGGEFWLLPNDAKQIDGLDDMCKVARDLKRSKSDVISNQPTKRATTLRNHQRSCSLNWNCKLDGPTSKWKKNLKNHVPQSKTSIDMTVNLLETQDRGNRLQELKFADSLISISAGHLGMDVLKARLDEGRRTLQQEEGKENKCLPWHARMQPRLLQVDGGVDSSSSGSEAGESPQRMIDESGGGARLLPTHTHAAPTLLSSTPPYLPLPPPYISSTSDQTLMNPIFDSQLPQIDGVIDEVSDISDCEDIYHDVNVGLTSKHLQNKKSNKNVDSWFKISQFDGNIDSESEGGRSPERNSPFDEELTLPLGSTSTDEEPVKCDECHCTYRTKQSYQRHLENCCNDFILSSSEGEQSEEEGTKKTPEKKIENLPPTSSKKAPLPQRQQKQPSPPKVKTEKVSPKPIVDMNEVMENIELNKFEVKKSKPMTKPRTYTRRRPAGGPGLGSIVGGSEGLQHVLLQQPTVIVQDASSLVPATLYDPNTLQYVVDPQTSFPKSSLIATPNPLVPGTFQIQASSDQLVSGLSSILPQGVQVAQGHHSIPSLILQPQQAPPLVMASDQMLLGPSPMFEVIQDPQTGGMYLASMNRPFLYNMETIVSNTVMQTNQFVSNMQLATSSFSQTSTHQVFQASKLEQVVNMPTSNFIVVGPNNTVGDKLVTTSDLICLQQANPLVQLPSHSVVNAPVLPQQQAFTAVAEPKLSAQHAHHRTIQPCSKPVGSSPLQNKQLITSTMPITRTPHLPRRIVYQNQSMPLPAKPVSVNSSIQKTSPMYARTTPMMRPSITKSPRQYERAVITPKKPRPRPLVEYINNFKSDLCDTTCPSISPPSTSCASSYSPTPPISSFQQIRPPSKHIPCTAPSTSLSIPTTPQVRSVSSTSLTRVPMQMSHVRMSTLPEVRRPNSTIQLPPLTHLPPAHTPCPVSVPLPATSSHQPIYVPSPPRTSTVSLPFAIDTSLPSGINPTPPLSSPKVESVPAPPVQHCLYPPPPMSFPFDRELKLSINMPSLEDSPPPSQTQQSPINCDNSTKKDSPGVLVPIQDITQIKLSPQHVPKSPQRPILQSPKEIKETNLIAEENLRAMKKLDSSDQNCVASKVVTIHPRLVQSPMKPDKNGKTVLSAKMEDKGPKLIFDVTSDDGFKGSSTSMIELFANICDSVQEMRAVFKIPPLPVPRGGHEVLGMQNHSLQHCLEQLRGVEQCVRYKCKYYVKESEKEDSEDGLTTKENQSGCARTESCSNRKEQDMFAWLASRHRRLPKIIDSAEEFTMSNRRANSLPMAMRYRILKDTAKLYVGVYRSKIHGKGLFCLREIEMGEMVIEYAGEVIRANLTDKREKFYTDRGIGCYMFRIDDHFVVDATMKGNAARFINHSCEPNCYSKVVDILGKKHIVIFALRRINMMEELTYDYKFPFEDDKISCHCLSKKCRKYLN